MPLSNDRTCTGPKRIVRSHKKSRTGCTACKKRRVKCNEAHPICGHCKRRKTECVYENEKDKEPEGCQQSLIRSEPLSFLDMTSLELFYHWLHTTSKTFALTESFHANVIRVVPPIAFRNPAVMHALLAVSALHLHHLQSARPNGDYTRYLSLAISHKNYVPPLLSQITNSDILILALSFFHTIEFADPRPTPDACDMFLIVGNIHKNFIGRELAHPSLKSFNVAKQIRMLSFDSLNTGNFGPIQLSFPLSLNRIHLPSPSSTSASPFNTSSGDDFLWPDSEELLDPVTSSTYVHATQTLMESWYLCQRPCWEYAAVSLWPVVFSERFYTYLLIEKRPRALVLFYYFCFILDWLAQLEYGGQVHQHGRHPSYNLWWAAGQTKFGESMKCVEHMLDERWMRCIAMTNASLDSLIVTISRLTLL